MKVSYLKVLMKEYINVSWLSGQGRSIGASSVYKRLSGGGGGGGGERIVRCLGARQPVRSPQDDRERNGGRGRGEERARGQGGGGGGGGRIAGVVLSVDQYSHIQTAEVGGGGERERARREGELLVMYSQSTSTVTSRQERERNRQTKRETDF